MIGNRDFSTHGGNQKFYDFDWKEAGWSFNNYPPYNNELEKPKHLDKMYDIAKKLSEKMAYVRIDLYEIEGAVYFGEITPYPCGGFYRYGGSFTYETDKMLGDLISLPELS